VEASCAAFTHGMWFSLIALAGLVAAGTVVIACVRRPRWG
jgi:hypothetical protein